MILSLNACAMGAPKPPIQRKCRPPLWEIENPSCIFMLNEDNEINYLCPEDVLYPKDLAGITLEDYNCERNYQDELIRECKKWRK